MFIGHNPGFEDLGLMLTGSGPERLMTLLKGFLPTAAVMELTFDVDNWADVTPGDGVLVRFTRPVDLDAALDGD